MLIGAFLVAVMVVGFVYILFLSWDIERILNRHRYVAPPPEKPSLASQLGDTFTPGDINITDS